MINVSSISGGGLTVRFPPVKRTKVLDLGCADCGKAMRRQKTETMTVSPFNKNPDGSQRTPQEIYTELGKVLDAWEREMKYERLLCKDCRPS